MTPKQTKHSDWLTKALAELAGRDPVEAMRDVEALLQLQAHRLKSLGINMDRVKEEEDPERWSSGYL